MTSTREGQYLTVDETKRPRANSDPLGLHFPFTALPEIKVTADDADDTGSNGDDEVDNFLVPPPPRPRSNTCPEDMFLQRKERPPTPPPTDIAKSPGSTKKRFNFSHTSKDFNGISFIHHKLCKVSEDGVGLPTRLNGHRRHSTGRRASCLAALAESNSLLEEEGEETEALAPAPMGLSHSMDSLSLSSGSVTMETSMDTSEREGAHENNKAASVFSNCSGASEKDIQSSIPIRTSNSSIR